MTEKQKLPKESCARHAGNTDVIMTVVLSHIMSHHSFGNKRSYHHADVNINYVIRL